MATAITCFFCQNLLSDWVDGLLPSARHTEVEDHIKGCSTCKGIQKDLSATRDVLRQLDQHVLGHELALRIMEVSHTSGRIPVGRRQVSRAVMVLSTVIIVFGALSVAFPRLFPWVTRIRATQNQAQFARYFPLLQGVDEVIEAQASWLHLKDPFNRSVWEEGGLSPEEFEKAFQGIGGFDKKSNQLTEDAN